MKTTRIDRRRGIGQARKLGVAAPELVARGISPEAGRVAETGIECAAAQDVEENPPMRNAGGIAGGDVPAVRCIADPYPEFSGVAGDRTDGRLIFGDGNHKSLLIYDRTEGSQS